MPGPLNRQPLGLLSLFDVKTGRYPGDLAETIAPTLEMQEWFRHAAGEHLTVADDVVGPGLMTSLGFTVPPTELWYVNRLSLSMGIEDDWDIRISWQMDYPLVAGLQPLYWLTSVATPAQVDDTAGFLSIGVPQPFILTPGSRVLPLIESFPVGELGNARAWINILRLRA